MRTTMYVLGSRAVGRSKARTYSYLRVQRLSRANDCRGYYGCNKLWISHEMRCWEIDITGCAVRGREFYKIGGESSAFFPWLGSSEKRIIREQQFTIKLFTSFNRLRFNCMIERNMLGSLLVLLQDPWLLSSDHPSAKVCPWRHAMVLSHLNPSFQISIWR